MSRAQDGVLTGQPQDAPRWGWFCTAVALEDSGPGRQVHTAQVDGRTWYSHEALSGEVFSVVRPEIDAETEREVGG